MDRPAGITILAILSFLLAVPALIVCGFFVMYAHREAITAVYWGFRSMRAFYAISAGLVLFAGCCTANGYALWHLRRWARPFTIFMLAATSLIVGANLLYEIALSSSLPWIMALLALDCLVLWYLFRPLVIHAFE